MKFHYPEVPLKVIVIAQASGATDGTITINTADGATLESSGANSWEYIAAGEVAAVSPAAANVSYRVG